MKKKKTKENLKLNEIYTQTHAHIPIRRKERQLMRAMLLACNNTHIHRIH